MREVVFSENLDKWSEDTAAAHHNEILAAVYTVTDPESATEAVDYGSDQVGKQYAGALRPRRLPKNFLEAISRAHDSSSRYPMPPIEHYDIQPVYNRGSTGLHYDGFEGVTPLSPLSLHFVLRGAVEAIFVPLTEDEVKLQSWPSRLQQHLTNKPYVDCNTLQGRIFYLPKEKIDDVDGQLVTLQAGQIAAFAAYGNSRSGRLPVAHQYVSVGETPEERNSRTSAFIDTNEIARNERSNWPLDKLLEKSIPAS